MRANSGFCEGEKTENYQAAVCTDDLPPFVAAAGGAKLHFRFGASRGCRTWMLITSLICMAARPLSKASRGSGKSREVGWVYVLHPGGNQQSVPFVYYPMGVPEVADGVADPLQLTSFIDCQLLGI